MSTVAKIAALLAMAESTTNEHEADAFLRKAQRLATHASVDLALARAATSKQQAREVPISRTIVIGELRKRANKHLIELFVAVGSANDLKIDIAHNSTYVIAYGMPSDIDVTEAIHNSLATQMVHASQVWLRLGEWRGSTYFRRARRNGFLVPVRTAHTMQSARSAFCAGFVERISARLQEARTEAVKEHHSDVRDESGALLSTAVVLREKDKEVAEFHKRNSQASGYWRGGAAAGVSGIAGQAGRAAGDRARIGSQGAIGGTSALPQ